MDLDFHESITGGSHVPSLPGQIHLQCRAPGSAFGKLLQSGWSISLYIYINPTSDTREVWKLFGYSKVQVCSSWLGWQNSKDTKKSLSVNNNEHPWRKMTKHEQKSGERIISHARTWHTRLFAQGWTGWTGGWAGWLASEGGPSSRGPKLDMRWQWAVNHLQHACTVVPVVIINSHLLKQFSRLKSASDMISFISLDCSDLTIFHWFNPSPYNSVLQHCTFLRLHVNKRLQF